LPLFRIYQIFQIGQIMPNHEPEETKRPESPKAPPAVKGPKTESKSEQTPRELTPEEQMALYEKDLKENDWGHQPC
jgi:hypothetical protein